MATKRIVPRASGEGGIGRTDKLMGQSFFAELGLSANVRFLEATVQTTNATPTVIWQSGTIPTGQALQVLALVVGADATGATCGVYMRRFAVRGTASGPSLMGSDALGTDREIGVTTMNVTGAVAGSALQISVAGRASTTMNWRAFVITVANG